VLLVRRAAVPLALAALAACGPGSGGPGGGGGPPRAWPQGRPAGYASPIGPENALPGDPGWTMGVDAAGPLQVYLDRVSARAGDVLAVKVSSDAPHGVRWTLYRFGWYGGAGARRVAQGGPATVGRQPACPMEAGTGMIRCGWATAFQLVLPAGAVSGYYGVKVTRDDGWAALAPLVVVDDRPADLLVQAAVATWEAYNAWGGESLYDDASRTLPDGLGARVSFDRPFAGGLGLGLVLRYEIPFARFLERAGYDVSYTTGLDVAAGGPPHLLRAGAFLSVGHDEYWSGEQRDAAEAARDAGMPLLFFGANVAYWKVRHEAPGTGGAPRVVTCWKTRGDATRDPVSGPGRTGRFRDPPIDRPENALVGVQYESWLIQRFPLVVLDPESWLYDGTGLRLGDTLPLVGAAEYDARADNGAEPAGLRVVAGYPVVDAFGVPGQGAVAHHRATSGALVFAAGSIEWPLGVDRASDAWDPRLERMTANVLREALGLPVPAAVGGAPRDRAAFAPPRGPFAASVSTAARSLDAPSGVTVLADGSLAVATPRANRVVRVRPGGAAEPLAGDGHLSSNPAYDGVPGARARFYGPTAVLALPDGSVLVSDTQNHCIRRIGADPAHTVTTFAGRMAAPGFADGAPGAARFRFPQGLARDPSSGAIYVADSGNHAVRVVDPRGNVATLAGGRPVERDGPAATAGIFHPSAVAVAPDGRVFVLATASGTVKSIATDHARTVTTLAGGGAGARDGRGDVARLSPQGGLVWAGGRLLVSDAANGRVRAVTPGAGAGDSVVSTYAGTGERTLRDGPGQAAGIGLPLGLAVAPDGRVFVADGANGAIRVLSPP
jgi:DNA-binding beta-propeller fold protein YncE